MVEMIMFKRSSKMGKEGDLSDFGLGMVHIFWWHNNLLSILVTEL